MAAFYNSHRTAEDDPLHEWWDFFTEWKEPVEVKKQTEEEMFETMMLFAKSTEGLSS